MAPSRLSSLTLATTYGRTGTNSVVQLFIYLKKYTSWRFRKLPGTWCGSVWVVHYCSQVNLCWQLLLYALFFVICFNLPAYASIWLYAMLIKCGRCAITFCCHRWETVVVAMLFTLAVSLSFRNKHSISLFVVMHVHVTWPTSKTSLFIFWLSLHYLCSVLQRSINIPYSMWGCTADEADNDYTSINFSTLLNSYSQLLVGVAQLIYFTSRQFRCLAICGLFGVPTTSATNLV